MYTYQYAAEKCATYKITLKYIYDRPFKARCRRKKLNTPDYFRKGSRRRKFMHSEPNFLNLRLGICLAYAYIFGKSEPHMLIKMYLHLLS